jgi:hypothetical protein
VIESRFEAETCRQTTSWGFVMSGGDRAGGNEPTPCLDIDATELRREQQLARVGSGGAPPATYKGSWCSGWTTNRAPTIRGHGVDSSCSPAGRTIFQLADFTAQLIVAHLLLSSIIGMIRELWCAEVFTGGPHVERGTDGRALMAQFMAHAHQAQRSTSPTPALRIQAKTLASHRLRASLGIALVSRVRAIAHRWAEGCHGWYRISLRQAEGRPAPVRPSVAMLFGVRQCSRI